MEERGGCPQELTYYFSLMSDWAYMGSERFQQLVHRYSLHVTYKPMQLPDLYARTGGIVLQKRSQQRQDYRVVELERWSELLGRPVLVNPPFYPADDLRAASAIVAVQQAGLDAGTFSDLLLNMVWRFGKDVSNLDTLRAVCVLSGIDADRIIAASGEERCANEVANNTIAASEDGVFGSPFFLYGKDRYWGQDRLPLLEMVIRSRLGARCPPLFQY